MLDKLKEKKGMLMGHFVSVLGVMVLSGIVATFSNEIIGFSTITAYLYALLLHSKVVKFIESKVK
jgi:uncharacterized membrane protein AbrB (regulator of aidB expression)